MLSGLDLFHREIKLNFDQSDKFTTNTGCFFTLCVVLVTLIQSILSFRSILYYESPQVTIDRTVLEIPGSSTLSSADFVFAVTMPYLNLSSSYITISIEASITFGYEDGSFEEVYTPLPWKRCSQEYLKNFSDIYYSWGLNEVLCPDFEEVKLSGTFFNPVIEQLWIVVSTCTNSTEHPDVICKPKEEIDSFFNKITAYYPVLLFYSNTIISPSNYSTPVTKYLSHTYWYLVPDKQTIQAEVFMNEQEILTDDNLLFEGWNPKNLTTYQIDSTEIRTQPSVLEKANDDSSYNLISIVLRKSNFKYTTRRLFPKLQEGLASVGSVFSLALGVFGIITAMYARRAFALNIANQLYEFDFNDLQQKEKIESQWKANKAEGSSGKQQEKSSMVKIRAQDTSKESAQEDSEFSLQIPKKRTIKYHFGDFLVGLTPCTRRKKDLLVQNAVKAAEKEIDLVEIVKKLHEFDKFKNLFLDEDEIRLLSYVQPPVISNQSPSTKKKSPDKKSKNNKQAEGEKKITTNKKYKVDIYNPTLQAAKRIPKISGQNETLLAFRSYDKLLKKQHHSQISRKILKLMNIEVNDTFFDFKMKFIPINGINLSGKTIEFGEVLRAGQRRTTTMSKLEAAQIFWEFFKKRRKLKKLKSANQKSKELINTSPGKCDKNIAEVSEDYSITSEKPLIQFSKEQIDGISGNKTDQIPLSAKKKNQFHEMSPSNMNQTSNQNVSNQNDQIDLEMSYVGKQEELERGKLPPITTFTKPLASNSYFI